jgi:tRNA dimethylallyltransferase
VKKAVLITGPTATGKSYLAMILAKKFNGEIVNADSMQVYKGMDIGTAKPTKKDFEKIPHHLFDICEITERFSAGEYAKKASTVISDIFERGKLPIIVGGTGLYTRALIKGFFQERYVDTTVEESLKKTIKKTGNSYLYNILKKVDKVFASKVEINDTQRIIRGLTFYFTNCFPLSSMWKETKPYLENIEYITIGLTANRKELYEAINKRVDKMFEEGLIEEVKSLLKKPEYKELHSFKAIGYRELIDFLEGRCTIEQAKEEIKKNSRRLAKRQITWFKDEKIKWFTVKPLIKKIPVEEILNYINISIEDVLR